MQGAYRSGLRRALAGALVLAAASVAPMGETGCLGATQVTLVLSTDVDCKQTITTTITTSAPDAPTAVPAATTTTCQSGGDLGTLVLVPSGDRGGHVNVEVVTAVGVPASACVRPAFGPSCIVARRSLGFLPHTGLTLPIAMRDACRGILCGPTDTCVSGICRSAALDPNACQDPGGCTEAALGPPAGPVPVTDGGAGDASADDASMVDAGLPDAATPAPEVLYTGTREIDSIALGDANLFFLESPTDIGVGDGAVRIMPKAGGASTLLAGALFQPVSLAANSTRLYWFESGSLQSVLKTGGTVSTIPVAGGVGTTPLSVQASNTFLYWGTSPVGSGAAFRAETNGANRTILGQSVGGVLSVALDQNTGTVAYASRVNANDTGEVQLRRPADAAPSLVATTSSLNIAFLTLVALSGDKLAWSDGAGGGTLMVKQKGGAPTAVATGQGAIFSIAIDATSIYWFHGAGHAVMLERASWTGDRATLLTGQTFTQALAMDASYLYYSQTGTSASLYRLHR